MITDEELKDWAGSVYAVGFKEVRRLIAEVKRLRAENAWVASEKAKQNAED